MAYIRSSFCRGHWATYLLSLPVPVRVGFRSKYLVKPWNNVHIDSMDRSGEPLLPSPAQPRILCGSILLKHTRIATARSSVDEQAGEAIMDILDVCHLARKWVWHKSTNKYWCPGRCVEFLIRLNVALPEIALLKEAENLNMTKGFFSIQNQQNAFLTTLLDLVNSIRSPVNVVTHWLSWN